jgi:mRNA interferase MazF
MLIQNNIMNQHGLLTIIMPLRSGNKKAPYIVNIKASSNNRLQNDSFIDIGQIRAVDHSRILGLIGVLEDQYWSQIRTAVNIVLGFEM